MSPFTVVQIASYLVTLMFGFMNTDVWGLLLDRLHHWSCEVSSSEKQKTGKCENTLNCAIISCIIAHGYILHTNSVV